MSIDLIDVVKPKNDADFGIVEDIDTLGGFRAVADDTERDAIQTGRRKEGMRIYVISTGKAQQLVGGIGNGDWADVPEAVFAAINRTLLGSGASTTGDGATSIGANATADANSTAIGAGTSASDRAVSIGEGASSISRGIAIGRNANAGARDVAIGRLVSTSGGGRETVIGTEAASIGSNSCVVGSLATGGPSSVAIGIQCKAPVLGSIAIGNLADSGVTGTSTVVGQGADGGTGAGTTAIGQNAACAGASCTAIGASASAAVGAFALGNNTAASALNSVGVGRNITIDATATRGVAVGFASSVASGHTDAMAIGANATTTAANRATVGTISGASDVELQVGLGLGVFGVAPPASQPLKINDPSGGATVDAESRTAINAIIDALEGAGLLSST